MSEPSHSIHGPHQGQPLLAAGEPLDRARAAMIMVHGRGASAESILDLAIELNQSGWAYLAPQAAGDTWYPYRHVAQAGIPQERTMLLGFSQGACLNLEFVARNARSYGGVAGLSGGLIGPDGTPRDYPGSLAGTPVFLCCSDVDFHVPKERVQLTAEVLQRLGGKVTMRLYPGMGHTVNQDEIDFVRGMMATLVV
ncbi:MAG: phospholipase [Chloroflexi bacterium]|nr:MAG: phospholipase [Chloroflexota bacterium]